MPTILDTLSRKAGIGGATMPTFTLNPGNGIKAPSAQNAGTGIAAPIEADPPVTLVSALRVPSAATGINWEYQPRNGWTVTQHLAIVHAGCAHSDHQTITQYTLDCEDQLRIMTLPVLRAFAPNITTNEVYLKVSAAVACREPPGHATAAAC